MLVYWSVALLCFWGFSTFNKQKLLDQSQHRILIKCSCTHLLLSETLMKNAIFMGILHFKLSKISSINSICRKLMMNTNQKTLEKHHRHFFAAGGGPWV